MDSQKSLFCRYGPWKRLNEFILLWLQYTLKTAGLKTTQFGLFWQPSTGSKRDEPSAGLF